MVVGFIMWKLSIILKRVVLVNGVDESLFGVELRESKEKEKL